MIEIVDVVFLLFSALIFVLGVLSFRKTGSSFRNYRTLSSTGESTVREVENGCEDAVVSGRIRVHDHVRIPVDHEQDENKPIGVYKWIAKEKVRRSRRRQGSKEKRTKSKSTGSGFEHGSVSIDDGTGELLVDFEELVQRYDKASSERSITKAPFKQTPVAFDARTVNRSFDDFSAVPQRLASFLRDRDAVGDESRSKTFKLHYVTDGDPITIRGAVTVDQGTPTIGGAETTSMMFTDLELGELTNRYFWNVLLFIGMGVFLIGFSVMFGYSMFVG